MKGGGLPELFLPDVCCCVLFSISLKQTKNKHTDAGGEVKGGGLPELLSVRLVCLFCWFSMI